LKKAFNSNKIRSVLEAEAEAASTGLIKYFSNTQVSEVNNDTLVNETDN
jgi:hypothetical protein